MPDFDQREHLLHIIEKFIKGVASSSEVAFLKHYYGAFEKEEDILNTLTAEERKEIEEKIENSIMASITDISPRSERSLWVPLSWAAAIIVLLSVGLYFYSSHDSLFDSRQQSTSAPVDILPGTNKATLTLSDGSLIVLDDQMEGEVAEQSGVSIRKAANGQIVYDAHSAGQSGRVDDEASPPFNIITTPFGGQYHVILPDGTNVWLNAGSSLKFPTTFRGKERKVELSGEGYFEVTRNERMPFKVSTSHQEIEVLGTVFNVNSYDDEPSIQTTLLEGSVRVTAREEATTRAGEGGGGKRVVLKPGEQSALTDGDIQVFSVSTEAVVAWKNGIFKFHNSDIGSVMRQLSKWYNVEVEFEGDMPDIRLWGEMDRKVKASEALEMLEYFNLKYRIIQNGDTKKIIIS